MTYINKVHCHSYVHVSTHRNVYIYSSIAFNFVGQAEIFNSNPFFIIVETIKVLFRLAASVISVGFLLRKVDEIMSLCQNMISLMEYFSSHIYIHVY